MSISKQSRMDENNDAKAQWQDVYVIGGIFAVITLLIIMFDIIFGSVSGGDLSVLPQTAVDRFIQFRESPLLGLYNLDLLNTINQLMAIPAYFALYAVHRKTRGPQALLALILFLAGTMVFVTTNTALPMLELANKYALATTESQKTLLAAAGEAMLARGAHGSMGVFIGFLLPTIASLAMSLVMLSGRVFGKATSYMGIAGNALMLIYIPLITFVPSVKNMAMMVAAPGGLLMLAWTIMYAIKLFQLGRPKNNS